MKKTAHVLIITRYSDLELFKRLIGDGSKLGIEITYKTQKEPNGIAEAFLIGQNGVLLSSKIRR